MSTQDENYKEEDKPDTYFAKKMQSSLAQKALYNKYLEEIKANESAMEYLSSFDADSVVSFIESYALKKTYWMSKEYDYAKWNEEEAAKWHEEGWRCLKEIQQKKLFDLQCLWRANQIELEGVEICYDFEIWERDILNCPCLPDITEDEVELYVQFLQSFNYEEHQFNLLEGWQSYTELKEAYHNDNADTNFPEWYDFYNGRKGTSLYLSLPDIRGEQEEAYEALWFERDKEENPPSQQTSRPYDNRPIISYWDAEHLMWFVETFEDQSTQEYFEANKELSWDSEYIDGYDGNVSEIVEQLKDANEIIPIRAHYDYRIALKRALDSFERKQISEALPIVYEQYLMRKEMGLTFAGLEADHYIYEIRNEEYERIKKGRELSGDDW